RVPPWLWLLRSNVKDVENSCEAGKGFYFHTPGGDRVLVPWGGEARISQKIDATDPSEVSEALVECRRMVMEEANRLRGSVSGFGGASVSLIGEQPGHPDA